jgi:hypothetical protein
MKCDYFSVSTYFLAGFIFLLSGCAGSSVMKASRVSILDEYFVMGPKRYKIYVAALARFSSESGRYAISGDTIYLLGKKSGKSWLLRGYALPDTSSGTVVFKTNDSNFSKTFRIHYYRPGY